MQAHVDRLSHAGAAQGPDDRLDSWKDIATFFKRGLWTVQRWEREDGLPVRRQVHGASGSVYALKSELTAWLGARDRGPSAPAAVSAPVPRPRPVGVPTIAPRKRGAWRRPAGLVLLALVAMTLAGPSAEV